MTFLRLDYVGVIFYELGFALALLGNLLKRHAHFQPKRRRHSKGREYRHNQKKKYLFHIVSPEKSASQIKIHSLSVKR